MFVWLNLTMYVFGFVRLNLTVCVFDREPKPLFNYAKLAIVT